MILAKDVSSGYAWYLDPLREEWKGADMLGEALIFCRWLVPCILVGGFVGLLLAIVGRSYRRSRFWFLYGLSLAGIVWIGASAAAYNLLDPTWGALSFAVIGLVAYPAARVPLP